MNETRNQSADLKCTRPVRQRRSVPPELYQVVIECRDEAQQRELFERLRLEGWRVRLLVL